MWITIQQNPEAMTAFNENILIPLKGKINIELMKKAYEEVIKRHDILRTIKCDGKHFFIQDEMDIDIPVISFNKGNSSDNNIVMQWIRDCNAVKINLKEDRPLRPYILEVSDESYIVFAVIHHLVADGWSIGVIQNEIIQIYLDLLSKKSIELPKAKQFSDYTDWIQRKYTSQIGREAQQYWKSYFSEPLSPIKFEDIADNKDCFTENTNTYSLVLDEGFRSQLNELSKLQNVSLFNIFLTAYSVLLYKIANQSRFVINIPTSGQIKSKFIDLVGHCVKMLPLYIDFDEKLTIKQFIQYIKETFFQAYKYQTFSINNVIEELSSENKKCYLPKCNIAFNLDYVASSDTGSDVIQIDKNFLFYNEGNNKYDLFMDILDDENQIYLKLEYNQEFFSRDCIENWALQTKKILKCMMDSQDERKITEL